MHVAFLVTGSIKITISMGLLVLPGFGNWEIVLKCLGREVKALEHRESGAVKMIELVGASFFKCFILQYFTLGPKALSNIANVAISSKQQNKPS